MIKKLLIFIIAGNVFTQTSQAQLGGLLGAASGKISNAVSKKNKEKKEREETISDFQKSNRDKIFFSNKPIVLGKENEADFKTSFEPNEKIYAVAYFNKGVNDMEGITSNTLYAMVVAPNGQPLFGKADAPEATFTLEHKLTETELKDNVTAWAFELIADEETATSTIPWLFAEMLTSVDVTKPSCELKLKMGALNIEGTFTINLKGVDGKKMIADAKQYTGKAKQAFVNAEGLPKEWKNYNANAFSDPNLSLANIKKYIKRDHFNCVEVLKVKMIFNEGAVEWTVKKDEFNQPIKKYSEVVGYVYKSKDGNCYIDECYFEKQYEGGGNYGEIRTSVIGINKGKSRQINCDNGK